MDLQSNILNIWSGGQLLAFSGIDGKTDSVNGLTARIAFDRFGIDIKLPQEVNITFPGLCPEKTLLTGDFFILQTEAGEIKGAFIDAYHLLIEGDCCISETELDYLQEGNKTLIGVSEYFEKQNLALNIDEVISMRSSWLEKVNLPGNLDTPISKTLSKAISQIKTQIYSPEGKISHYWSTPDRWPHRDMWLWDSVFHAVGMRHLDATMAREILDAVFDLQQDNGFIAHQGNPRFISKITQPPVLALGVKLVNEKLRDENWIKEIYPKLKAYLQWNTANRDSDGNGLLEWFIEGDVNCRSGESGMDNSPRFDAATQIDAVDFNSFQALEYQIMSEFAQELGKKEEARSWQIKHKKMCHLINEFLWNNYLDFYVDFDTETNKQSGMMSSAGFLPLICGAPSQQHAEKLVAQLQNPETFATAFPVPSIAKCSGATYAKDMWRGPVWINLNWLIAMGLKNYGFTAEADKLIDRTLAEQVKMYETYGTFFEFYDDRGEVDPPQLLRKTKCAPEESPYHQVLFDYGWSATLFIDMCYSKGNQRGEASCLNNEKAQQFQV